VLRTSNAGQTWLLSQTPEAVTLSDIWFTGPSIGWAAGENMILHSVDGGVSWFVQHRMTKGRISRLYFASDLIGWAVGGPGLIFLTTDGGATWNALKLPLLSEGRYRYFYHEVFYQDIFFY
jgi:photosystem II stability/assembly factor-like uncharacterized protein